ncbi:hypothetical protein [Mucilaginibacter sp. HD30]
MASIAPNGVKLLIDYPNNYSSGNAIPFATTFEYDLQGRVIASTSTDGGRSEFIYRRDGSLRFSQNAAQQSGQCRCRKGGEIFLHQLRRNRKTNRVG